MASIIVIVKRFFQWGYAVKMGSCRSFMSNCKKES